VPFIENKLLTEQEADDALKRLSISADLSKDVSDCDFVMEAATENLSLKQNIFLELEACCPEKTIFATNTSSLTLAKIGEKIKNRQRLVTAHWFNPPHIVPVVEVVRGPETNDETFNTTFDLLKKINKVPVRVNADIPGFLINRISGAMTREILDLYDKNIASAEDIDRAVKGTIGFQFASIGPLQRMDFGGLDLWLQGLTQALPVLQNSVEPPKALKKLVSQGHTGIKSGKGFYDYKTDFSKDVLDKAIQKRDQDMIGRLKRNYIDKLEE
jgi:3-hydroxybutyryl-CoA dehydrogenase